MRKCVVPGFVCYYLLLPGLTKFVYFACSSFLMVFDTVFRECFLTLLGSYYVLALVCEMTKGCWINLLCYSDKLKKTRWRAKNSPSPCQFTEVRFKCQSSHC